MSVAAAGDEALWNTIALVGTNTLHQVRPDARSRERRSRNPDLQYDTRGVEPSGPCHEVVGKVVVLTDLKPPSDGQLFEE